MISNHLSCNRLGHHLHRILMQKSELFRSSLAMATFSASLSANQRGAVTTLGNSISLRLQCIPITLATMAPFLETEERRHQLQNSTKPISTDMVTVANIQTYISRVDFLLFIRTIERFSAKIARSTCINPWKLPVWQRNAPGTKLTHLLETRRPRQSLQKIYSPESSEATKQASTSC